MKKFALLIVLMILAMACISEKETPQTPPLPPNGTPSVTTPPQTTPASTTQPPTTQPPTTTAPPTTVPSTLGDIFAPVYKDKMWSTYMINSEGEETQMIWKMFDDGDIYVFEYEFEIEGVTSITQMWSAKSGSPQECSPVKHIMKVEDMVYCTNSMPCKPAESYTPEKYDKYTVIRKDTYTTPTGKTVEVFIVSDGKDEIWFSEEVPFSIVKIVTDGELSMILNDFGFDAERKISREEGENCISMTAP